MSCPRSEVNRASVLVIDDEQMMCNLLVSMLEDDYRVTALSSSREALARLLAGESFDVLLCDLMMPELTGMDLHIELLQHRPDQAARMVFMTGGTFTARAGAFLDRVASAPLMKPFRYDELRRIIEERLQQNESRMGGGQRELHGQDRPVWTPLHRASKTHGIS